MNVSRMGDWGAWALQVLVAAAFLAAGAAKLTGTAFMVDLFHAIGLGQWFRYVTGAIEVVGGVALLTRGSAPFGAALLACTMACAIFVHIVVLHSSPAAAMLLLALLLAVLWLRRDRLGR